MFAAWNKPLTNSQKKSFKFMRGNKRNFGKCWFDAKQTSRGRLEHSLSKVVSRATKDTTI